MKRIKRTHTTTFLSILLFSFVFISCEKDEDEKDPIACFEADKQTAFVNESISFTNCSEDATAFYWEFGDGTTSVEHTPSHAWDTAGTYEVTLQALAGEESDIETMTVTIEPDPAPVACFEISQSTIKVGDTLEITNCSEKAETYEWDFGDGTTSTEETPEHAYESPGNYTISLSVENDHGNDEMTADVEVVTSGVLLTDGFEDYEDFTLEFGDWEMVDNDEGPTYGVSGVDYPNYGYVGSYIIFNPSKTDPPLTDDDQYLPHSGDKYAACFSAKNVSNNDDWLISPEMTLGEGYTLTVYIKSLSDEYGPDYFQIQAHEGETVHWLTPEGESIQPPTEWKKYSYDLSSLKDKTVTINIGCLSEDAFALLVDDIIVTNEKGDVIMKQDFEQTSDTETLKYKRE